MLLHMAEGLLLWLHANNQNTVSGILKFILIILSSLKFQWCIENTR